MNMHISDEDFQSPPSAEIGSTSANIAPFDLRRGKVSWQNEIVNSLLRFLELPIGWDSYRGRPLRHDTGMFALQVMNCVLGPSIPTPHLVPIADGGVQLEWHQNGFDIELYISAPYECELVISDHASGETKVTQLTTDFSPLNAALRELVNYNRQYADAG